MSKEESLTVFIDRIIDDYHLPRTDKIKANLRKKFVDVLKNNYHFSDKKVWQNAKKEKIGKTQTRVFDTATLNEVLRLSQDYLFKLSNKQSTLTKEQLAAMQKEAEQKLWQQPNSDPDADDQWQIQQATESYCLKVRKEAILNAIFEQYYTPLKIDKIEEDQGKIYYSNYPSDEDTVEAIWRLDHPEGIYYKRK